MGIRRYWPVIRRVWITVGLTLTAVFVVWSLIAYRPTTRLKSSTLVFFPGALVSPKAYAPLARSVAEAGYPVLVVELPYRGAFGGAESPELQMRIASALASITENHSIVVGGHSRGAVIASRLSVRTPEPSGVILIGTSHPRDVDLSRLEIPVTKIVGTRDGIATQEKVVANAFLLPDRMRWVWIDGGNHSQFGWYGFQPMDWRANISAAEQRNIMTQAVLDLMQTVDSNKNQRIDR